MQADGVRRPSVTAPAEDEPDDRAANGVDDRRPPLPPGSQLAAGYTVLGHLDRGYLLDVYDVWSEARRCRCVAKILRPEHAASRSERRDLLREGWLVRGLTHPHIVRCYEVIAEPEVVVVFETLTGATLHHLVATRGRGLPRDEILHLGIHLCSALFYLRGKGVLHLDLKPSNIVAERGFAKLLDFSIARRPGRGHRGVGTPGYMAPEQSTGGMLGPATDVWGLGTVLYEAISGEPPFAAAAEPVDEAAACTAARLRRSARCPDRLARLVEGCLQREPALRPGLDEIWSTLQSLLG